MYVFAKRLAIGEENVSQHCILDHVSPLGPQYWVALQVLVKRIFRVWGDNCDLLSLSKNVKKATWKSPQRETEQDKAGDLRQYFSLFQQ